MAQLELGLPVSSHGPSRAIPPSRRSVPARSSAAARQLTLALAGRPDGGISGVIRVETLLRSLLGPKVIVTLTSNRATMLSFVRRRGVLYLRLHALFGEAPEAVLRACAAYANGRATEAEEELLDQFIEAHRHRLRKPDDRDLVVQPHGEVHDLASMLQALNAAHFGGKVEARITWSRALKKKKKKRHSMRLGSYCDEQKLIRIHPALDQEYVPAYFVESVVFHEMLHQLHGIHEGPEGRRCFHPPAFLEDERRFPDYERARAWEAKNLGRLLRY